MSRMGKRKIGGFMSLFISIVFMLMFIAIATRLACLGQGWKTWIRRSWKLILIIGVILGLVLDILNKLL